MRIPSTFFCLISGMAILLAAIQELPAQTLIIQELETGFCSIDGDLQTDNAGYTGVGFVGSENKAGTTVSWNFAVDSAQTVGLFWRFANRGGTGDRDVQVFINGTRVDSSFNFPYTGAWTTWWETDTLYIPVDSGETSVRLIANNSNGLANIDYFAVIGTRPSAAYCPPSYYLRVAPNFNERGSVEVLSGQDYYDSSAVVTVVAEPAAGYFFQSWTGEASSIQDTFTFSLNENTDLIANFYPLGTKQDSQLCGYASIQDDMGTPYLMVGGAGGDTVRVSTYGELRTYLQRSEPHVLLVDRLIDGNNRRIDVRSFKTILGVTDSAQLYGVELAITNGAYNVIIKDMKMSHSVAADVIGISGGAHHVWIHNCELFSDRDNGKDYYDGLLDIKNEASFITVSWSVFRDHFKSILMASNDESFRDSVARITFHHNYFYNNGSRLPLIRFGKAHIFNNFYENNDSGINPRMGACVKVEKNYFDNSLSAIRVDMSAVVGYMELEDNIFINSNHATGPNCTLPIPYDYAAFLDSAADVPSVVVAGAGTTVAVDKKMLPKALNIKWVQMEDGIHLLFQLDKPQEITLEVLDLSGRRVVKDKGRFAAGSHSWLIKESANLPAALLFVRIQAGDAVGLVKFYGK